MKDTTQRLANIDILRGLAAMLVAWQHSSERFVTIPTIGEQGTMLFDIAYSLDFGRIGVVCFFLISGFVIPYSFSDGSHSVRRFAVRRFLRLYPVYWLSIIAAILVGSILTSKEYTGATIFANITMMQKFFGQDHIIGLYWTLQAEVIFYLLCAFMFAQGVMKTSFYQLVACLSRLALFLLLAALTRYVEPFQSLDKELVYLPYVLAIMFVGTLMRGVLSEKTNHFHFWLALVLTFGFPCWMLFLHYVGLPLNDQPVRFFFGHILSLVMFALGYALLNRDLPFLIWCGTISYSFYLFHPLVIDVLMWITLKPWGQFLASLHLGLHIVMVLIITFGLASTVYLFVERPSIRLGRKIKFCPDN